jgi:hypothetical protein
MQLVTLSTILIIVLMVLSDYMYSLSIYRKLNKLIKLIENLDDKINFPSTSASCKVKSNKLRKTLVTQYNTGKAFERIIDNISENRRDYLISNYPHIAAKLKYLTKN